MILKSWDVKIIMWKTLHLLSVPSIILADNQSVVTRSKNYKVIRKNELSCAREMILCLMRSESKSKKYLTVEFYIFFFVKTWHDLVEV